MFKIRRAKSEDVDPAVAALVEAFDQDPLMLFLFEENPTGIRAGVTGFFSILLRARIALNMPAFVLQQDHEVRGALMGYDTSRPTWPRAITAEWGAFEAGMPGFADRLGAYEKICEAHQPSEDHYYLGVIGVHPLLQGQGAGKALLKAFCELSSADARSRGVYLDTANPSSLEFYTQNGFERRGEGRLGDAPLWCVFRPS